MDRPHCAAAPLALANQLPLPRLYRIQPLPFTYLYITWALSRMVQDSLVAKLFWYTVKLKYRHSCLSWPHKRQQRLNTEGDFPIGLSPDPGKIFGNSPSDPPPIVGMLAVRYSEGLLALTLLILNLITLNLNVTKLEGQHPLTVLTAHCQFQVGLRRRRTLIDGYLAIAIGYLLHLFLWYIMEANSRYSVYIKIAQ